MVLIGAQTSAQFSAIVGRSYPGSPAFNFDADGAVGPAHFAEITNLGLRVVLLADGSVRYNDYLSNFWKKALGETANTYDPHIEYDHASGRWFVIALTNTNIYLAVSDTTDPAATWKGFKIEADSTHLRWPDYPFLGIDGSAIYIRANMIGFDSATLSGEMVLTIPKADLMASNASIGRMSRLSVIFPPAGTALPSSGTGLSYFALPQIDYLGTATDGVLIASPGYGFSDRAATGKLLSVFISPYQKMSGQDLGVATLTPWSNLPGVSFPVDAIPPNGAWSGATQPGTSQKLGTNSGNNNIRVGDFIYSSIIFAQMRAGIMWSKFRVSTATVVDAGIIWDADHDYFEPSIAANPDGNVIVAFVRSSPSEFASLYCALGQPSVGGKLSFGSPIRLKAGYDIYDENGPKFNSGRSRFSDYTSAVSVHPLDHSRFWVSGAWVSARNVASTWISEIVVTSTPPTTVAPKIIAQSTANVTNAAPNSNVAFAIEADGSPTPTYQWQRMVSGGSTWANISDDPAVRGATTANLTVNTVTVAMSGDQYRCVVSNAYGTTASAPILLSVEPSYVVTVLAGSGTAGANDGLGANAQFSNFISGLAVDRAGNLIVADTGSYTIRRISPSGGVSTLAGLAGTRGTVDGVGASARFEFPNAVATDQSGNIFVGCSGGGVRKVAPSGAVTTVTGASSGASVLGVAADVVGNLYVSENSPTIRKMAVSGVATTLAGKPLASGSDDGIGTDARFNFPGPLAVDLLGYLYLNDQNNTVVRRVSPAGVVTTFAGKAGEAGNVDGLGDVARFGYLYGVAVDTARNVFVADFNNHGIRKISTSGLVTTPRMTVAAGIATSTGNPRGIAVDNDGNLYFSSGSVIYRATPIGLPKIQVQPSGASLAVGNALMLSVAATSTDAPVLAYQWQKDGVAIPGATSSTFTIARSQLSDAGRYNVAVTNAYGSITSVVAAVTVEASHLSNLSILASLAAGETITMGTVIGGAGTSGSKAVLARAAGPSLTQFGITAFLPNPTITLNSTSTTTAIVVASNTGWVGSATLGNAFAQVGAFPYSSPSSKDSALYQNGPTALVAGSYTVQVTDKTGGSGSVIAELYDATPSGEFVASTPRLINVSVLKQLAAGSSLTVGFVIGGSSASVKVLLRAVGPTLGLAPFNISGVMANPKLELLNNATGQSLDTSTGWSGDSTLVTAFTSVGAFQLANANTNDSALLVTLAPGQYSARVSGGDGGGGTVIVEVYEVP